MNANSGNPRLRYLELADVLPRNLRLKNEEAEEEHDHGHGHHHHHGEFDPHVWLGIPQAIGMVERIRDELKSVDSRKAAQYDSNAAAYIERLKKLHEDGKAMVNGLEVPILTFLDTRGVDEPGYDPAEDLAAFDSQAHLLVVTSRLTDFAHGGVRDALARIRAANRKRPVVLALNKALSPMRRS